MKKLQLNKQIIAQLDDHEMGQIQGGTQGSYEWCPTMAICPSCIFHSTIGETVDCPTCEAQE